MGISGGPKELTKAKSFRFVQVGADMSFLVLKLDFGFVRCSRSSQFHMHP